MNATIARPPRPRRAPSDRWGNHEILHGKERLHETSGITVEYVQCYEGCWDVFMLRDGVTCACHLSEQKRVQSGGYLSGIEAERLAKQIYKELTESYLRRP